jgi:hypothetical protein
MQTITPETFRLPTVGQDPFFGFSRSFYYNGEKRGWWKLVRIRDAGKDRGITLVPYEPVRAFVQAHMEAAENESA